MVHQMAWPTKPVTKKPRESQILLEREMETVQKDPQWMVHQVQAKVETGRRAQRKVVLVLPQEATKVTNESQQADVEVQRYLDAPKEGATEAIPACWWKVETCLSSSDVEHTVPRAEFACEEERAIRQSPLSRTLDHAQSVATKEAAWSQ